MISDETVGSVWMFCFVLSTFVLMSLFGYLLARDCNKDKPDKNWMGL